MKTKTDSICAIATPSGPGGIGVLRASGDKALKAARKFCSFLPPKPQSHKAYVGLLKQGADVVDEVVVTYFQAGRSYTGDEVIEVSCHGSDVVLSKLIKMFLSEGLRLADRGEFTCRAFLNNKIDLIQAESVLSLIESQSEPEAQAAALQLKGSLSNQIHLLKDQIEFILAHIEASIDYSDRDVKTLSPAQMLQKLEAALLEVKKLLTAYQRGQNLKQGTHMVLVGAPNVGKSSLINALLGYDRSIVSQTPGTTRDYIEASFLIEGQKIQIYDTAGLRSTNSPIEQQGLKKTYDLLKQSQFKVFVFDLSTPLFKDKKTLKKNIFEDLFETHKASTNKNLNNKELLSYFNKCHQKTILAFLQCQNRLMLGNKKDKKVWSLKDLDVSALLKSEICALDPNSIEHLKLEFKKILTPLQHESVVLLSLRQYEALQFVYKKLKVSKKNLTCQQPYELVALDLQEALQSVLQLLGHRLDKQIIDKIFSQFCIGK